MKNIPSFNFSTARSQPSRAQLSPLIRRALKYTSHLGNRRRSVGVDLDVAERAFLSRWLQPALLDRLQPVLTRYHE